MPRATGSVRGCGGCHGQQALYVEVEGASATSSVFILHSSVLCSEQRLFFCKQTSCGCCLSTKFECKYGRQKKERTAMRSESGRGGGMWGGGGVKENYEVFPSTR